MQSFKNQRISICYIFSKLCTCVSKCYLFIILTVSTQRLLKISPDLEGDTCYFMIG